MKVLTYLHSFEPGGLERDVLRFNRAWREHGVDARIVLGRNEGPLASEAPELPYTVLQKGKRSTGPIESLWMAWHLPREVRRQRPDIVFCAGNSYTIVAVALRLVLGRSCPPIVYRVSNDVVRRDLPAPLRLAHHVWQRLQAPVFARIVAMAEPARDDIIAEMRADPKRVLTINNASLTTAELDRLAHARSTVPRQRNGRHFVAVGRLAAQKNFALLLSAFARVAGPQDRLTIVGEGPKRSALERQAQELGIADRLSMPGHQASIDRWLAEADALVLSSDYEGLGIVVIEALAAGLPVVATDCGPNMKMLVGGVGELVPPRNVGALAAAMAAIFAAPVDVGAMRDRARAFTVETNVGEWVSLFGTLAA